MTKSNLNLHHFQTSAFRLSEPETFFSLACVDRIVNVMNTYQLSHQLDGGYISLSLPSSAFAISDFDDNTNKVTRDDLLGLTAAIEANIHCDDACKLVYVESKVGEYFDCYTSTIERDGTDTTKVGCDKSKRLGRH